MSVMAWNGLSDWIVQLADGNWYRVDNFTVERAGWDGRLAGTPLQSDALIPLFPLDESEPLYARAYEIRRVKVQKQ